MQSAMSGQYSGSAPGTVTACPPASATSNIKDIAHIHSDIRSPACSHNGLPAVPFQNSSSFSPVKVCLRRLGLMTEHLHDLLVRS